MEIIYLIIGILLGATATWFYAKSQKTVSAEEKRLNEKLIEEEKQKLVLQTQIENLQKEIDRLAKELQDEREYHQSVLSTERAKYEQEINTLRNDYIESTKKLESARTHFQNQEQKIKEQKEQIEELHKKLTTEFENIANKILDEKSQKFTEQNKNNLDIILNPLKDKIKQFEEKVEKAYNDETKERISLKTEIKNLIELNNKINEEAKKLAVALKGDTKKQGNWGEIILEKVLERSGLIKGQEYKTQYSTTNYEGNRVQPDVVVFLPDNKHIVIDSKVSLTAYEAFVNAELEADKNKFIKAHVDSIKNHVNQLSEKNYQTSSDFNTPDFVLMFMPIESAFSAAIQYDTDLFAYAWDKKIVLVSPTTLLATLRTIASIWKHERQTKNALEIAKQSGALFDKFVGFLEDLEKIGKNIDASKNAYDAALNKLKTGSGNIISRTLKIQQLGAKTQKQIPDKFISDDDINFLSDSENA
ncbi:MAG: DNA recombination protein RmuC [Bacteroidia bacterium]